MHTLDEIKTRIEEFCFDRTFDMIVAVANGGIIPAALLNQRLHLPFHTIRISFRDTDGEPLYPVPRLKEPILFDPGGRRILLVEDRVKTGETIRLAKALLKREGAFVRTFAVNGPADYWLYNEPCFKFPWII